MKSQVIAAAIAAAITFSAGAQQRGPAMEAVVTVTNLDPLTRTVWVRTSKGETPVLVPPEVDVKDILPGTRYRVRYSEPVAVAIAPGAQGLKVERVSGVVEAIDPASRHIAVRTLDGRSVVFAVAEDAMRLLAERRPRPLAERRPRLRRHSVNLGACPAPWPPTCEYARPGRGACTTSRTRATPPS
jgi:hypothetical protein